LTRTKLITLVRHLGQSFDGSIALIRHFLQKTCPHLVATGCLNASKQTGHSKGFRFSSTSCLMTGTTSLVKSMISSGSIPSAARRLLSVLMGFPPRKLRKYENISSRLLLFPALYTKTRCSYRNVQFWSRAQGKLKVHNFLFDLKYGMFHITRPPSFFLNEAQRSQDLSSYLNGQYHNSFNITTPLSVQIWILYNKFLHIVKVY